MGLIIRLLKLRITKVLIAIILIAFVASLYFYRTWYEVQYHKLIGCYYVYRGDKAYVKGQYQKAVDNYKEGLKHYPGHSKACWNLGNIYVSFENYYEAVNLYEQALRYRPDFMVCRMDLGIILSEEMADYDKAIQEYGRVINSKPFELHIPLVFNNKKTIKENKGIAYYNMGIAYRQKAVYMGDNSGISVKYLKKAKESYLKAAKYLKNDFDNTYNLAFTNHLLGNYSEAGDNYCSAINIKPDSFEAHYNFALLLRTMGLNKEALEEFERTTMLLGYYGNDEKNKYVYGIITEIKRRIMNEGNFDYLKERTDVSSLSEEEIPYSKGKVDIKKQKDLKVSDLFKCTYSGKFKDEKK